MGEHATCVGAAGDGGRWPCAAPRGGPCTSYLAAASGGRTWSRARRPGIGG